MVEQTLEAPAEPEARPDRRSMIRSRLATVEAAVTAAFVVPLVAWAWRVVGFGNRFQYWSDHANLELASLDVGREFVAIGAYSRMVWSHPGPLGFYLLALPSHLSRQNSIGVALGVLAINAVAVAGMLVLARRRGGTPLLLITAGMLAVFLHGLGPAFLVDVWNPSLPVLPFALLLFLCWSVALRERASLPLAVAVASFCVQQHVGYVVVALFPLLVAVLISFRSTWIGPKDERRARLRPWFRSAGIAALVGLILWAPPIIEEIQGNPGNLILLGAYFNDGNGETPVGLDGGWERQSMAFGIRPTWITGEPPPQLTFESGWRVRPDPPVTLVALALGLFLAVRRRDREAVLGGSIAAVAVVTGVFATSRITGFMYLYLTRWSMAVGWFAALIAIWLLVRALLEWRPSFQRATVSVAAAVLVVMAVLFTSNVVHARNPQEPWGPIAHDLAVQVRDNLPPGDGPVQFLTNDDFQAQAHRSALVTALERVGIETSVDNHNPVTHGKWRTGFAEDPRVTLMVVADGQIADYEEAGFKRIALVRPQSAQEQRATERYIDDIERRVDEGDFPSWDELRRAAYLGELHTLAVYQVPDVED